METGGRDVTFRWAMASERVSLVLAYIRIVWPKSRLCVDPQTWDLKPIATVPTEFFVYASEEVLLESFKSGVTPELGAKIIHIKVDKDGIDFVAGEREGCASECLMHGIINTLKASFLA